MMVTMLHWNWQLRTERDIDTEKECQKPAVHQSSLLMMVWAVCVCVCVFRTRSSCIIQSQDSVWTVTLLSGRSSCSIVTSLYRHSAGALVISTAHWHALSGLRPRTPHSTLSGLTYPALSCPGGHLNAADVITVCLMCKGGCVRVYFSCLSISNNCQWVCWMFSGISRGCRTLVIMMKWRTSCTQLQCRPADSVQLDAVLSASQQQQLNCDVTSLWTEMSH